MLISFFAYLIQATVSLAVFALAYRLFFSRLTHFHWNRAYLLASVFISGLVPAVPTAGLVSSAVPTALAFRFDPGLSGRAAMTVSPAVQAGETGAGLHLIAPLLLGLYLAGFLYKSGRLYRNLAAIFRLLRTYQKVEENPVYSVYFQSDLPTFSFWRAIFLNSDDEKLSLEEQAQVLLHEELHVRHRHTLDLLLFELAGVVFWFNPLVAYLHVSIRQVHEYTVDAIVTRTCGTVKQYGYLLLKLTSQTNQPLLATFSDKQVFRRIQMLTQKPSKPMQKLKFLLVLPLLALLLISYSCFDTPERPVAQTEAPKPAKGLPIGQITWKGNTVFSAERLTNVLGMQPGDRYDKKVFADRLINQAGTDVASLYMDNGYLFFNVEVSENRVGDRVNLVLQVSEGKPFRTGKVTFKGNQHVSAAQLAQTITVRPGELFNRSQLIKSQQILAESGHFKPGTIGINPLPDFDHGTVNLEFTLVEKP
ncbi:hypothetical protein GCM10027299_39260 [Larkinella ripae]